MSMHQALEQVQRRNEQIRELAFASRPGRKINPASAVEGEAQDKAQAFRSERNGPVPRSAVAGIGAMSGVPNASNEVPSNKKTLKHYGLCLRCSTHTPRRSTSHAIELRNPSLADSVNKKTPEDIKLPKSYDKALAGTAKCR